MTHSKITNEERVKLNAVAKQLEKDFIKELTAVTPDELVFNPSKVAGITTGFIKHGEADVEGPLTKREPTARKLTKKV